MDAAGADVSLVFVLNSDRHLGSRGESESVFDESVRVADHDEDAEAVRREKELLKVRTNPGVLQTDGLVRSRFGNVARKTGSGNCRDRLWFRFTARPKSPIKLLMISKLSKMSNSI